MSTAFHPQTDGETERVNQELEQYLRVFCNFQVDNWAELIPFMEFAHNARTHSATTHSPFQVLLRLTAYSSAVVALNTRKGGLKAKRDGVDVEGNEGSV